MELPVILDLYKLHYFSLNLFLLFLQLLHIHVELL
jgi:hypothetical protein